MILRIDTTSSIPVYEQIVEQAKRAVATGAIKPGDALPVLRERGRPADQPADRRQGLQAARTGRRDRDAARTGQLRERVGAIVGGQVREQALARGIDNVLLDAMQLGGRV